MTIKSLPGAPEGRVHAGVSSPLQPRALDRWNPAIRAAADESDDERSISVYDVIGVRLVLGQTASNPARFLRRLRKAPIQGTSVTVHNTTNSN
ncbi:MAG TPA: hypothetical protein VK972_05125, partial [Wenzhouxiangella sp.]|nr:hypothetical protein [Wenzhouxiangella sp.]